MNFTWYCESPVFARSAGFALALLVVHAWKTHGALFAAIWIVLTGLLGTGTAALMQGWSTTTSELPPSDRITIDAPLFFAASFYLAALFGKGFVERTRFAGSPVALASASAICWLPFGWSWLGAALESTTWTYSLDVMCTGSITSDLGYVAPSGFLPGFAVALFLFALAYRLISLKTQNNAHKLLILTPLTPLFAVTAAWLGSRV